MSDALYGIVVFNANQSKVLPALSLLWHFASSITIRFLILDWAHFCCVHKHITFNLQLYITSSVLHNVLLRWPSLCFCPLQTSQIGLVIDL